MRIFKKINCKHERKKFPLKFRKEFFYNLKKKKKIWREKADKNLKIVNVTRFSVCNRKQRINFCKEEEETIKKQKKISYFFTFEK